MKIKVVYHSMTGNTKKIAEALAKTAGISAEALTDNFKLTEATDLLFIGDGIYAGKMNKNTKKFLETLDGSLVKNAAVFGTYGGQDKVIHEMTALLKGKGISVCSESFVCKGQSWFFANKKHPDQTDMNNAMDFVKRVMASVENS